MNIDLMLAVVFYGLLILAFFKYRNKFEVQSKIFVMYKTKLGLRLMDRLSKIFPRFLKLFGVLGFVIGFLGMFYILIYLIKGTLSLILIPETQPALAPVLPGVKVLPGLPILSFWHWIFALFIVAVSHEFFHGLYARLYSINVKSSGFAFLGPILAAFVEPDEKQVEKKSKTAQLSMFAAGPFINIILGILFLFLFLFISAPFEASFFESTGIIVNEAMPNLPAANTGIEIPFVITSIDNKTTANFFDFINITTKIKPNQEIELETDKGNFKLVTAVDPKNDSHGYIGLSGFEEKKVPKQSSIDKYGNLIISFISWINLLFFWCFVVNIGVGLFNLLPLGPIDGGRMMQTLLLGIFKKQTAVRIFNLFTLLCVFLILINLMPFLWRFISFLFKPLILLIGGL